MIKITKKKTIRHTQGVLGRPNKHSAVNNYVSKIINNWWKMVIPITMDILQNKSIMSC